MRWIAIAASVLLAGCDLLFGLSDVDYERDATLDNSPFDALCLGTGLVSGLCVESTLDTLTLNASINTMNDPRCRKVPQADGPELCVLDATNIVVAELVYVSGDRPLVLLARTQIEVAKALDASSKLGVRIGAAAQTTCASGNGSDGGAGAGGGGGGTFGFLGGVGGAGQMGAPMTSPGGTPTPVVPQSAVFGGCAGGNGGVVLGSTTALGAPGGGALYLIAGGSIHVVAMASINASGGGGAGGKRESGGGGGGAGGFIALDAPMIVLDGPVFARGGGGGGGGGSATTDIGQPGADPAANTATPGGTPATGGSRGGDGCGTPSGGQGGQVSNAPFGGGGGGGGCGRIRVYGTLSGSGTLSPAPT